MFNLKILIVHQFNCDLQLFDLQTVQILGIHVHKIQRDQHRHVAQVLVPLASIIHVPVQQDL